jgi:hypothetical protein
MDATTGTQETSAAVSTDLRDALERRINGDPGGDVLTPDEASWTGIDAGTILAYANTVHDYQRRRILSHPHWDKHQVLGLRDHLKQAGLLPDTYLLMGCDNLPEQDAHAILDDLLATHRRVVTSASQWFGNLPKSIIDRIAVVADARVFAMLPLDTVPSDQLVWRLTGAENVNVNLLRALLEREDITAWQRWRVLRAVRKELDDPTKAVNATFLREACVFLRTEDPAAGDPEVVRAAMAVAPVARVRTALHTLLRTDDGDSILSFTTTLFAVRPELIESVLVDEMKKPDVPSTLVAYVTGQTHLPGRQPYRVRRARTTLQQGGHLLLLGRALDGDRDAAALYEQVRVPKQSSVDLMDGRTEQVIQYLPWADLGRAQVCPEAPAAVSAELEARGGSAAVEAFEALLDSHQGPLAELRDAILAAAGN